MTQPDRANPDEGSPALRGAGTAAAKGDWVGVVVNRSSGKGSGPRLVARLIDALGGYGLDAQGAWTPDETIDSDPVLGSIRISAPSPAAR